MNLFELFVKVGVDDQASSKLGTLTQKLGSGLKTAAKIGTAAVSVAAAGIAALTTTAIKNYAEYEQLVGGVDTLFKSSSQKVQEYAANAYKTAGMSANEYMSTVTSFSASLLQSLGGDTEKAAEYANQALTDMSDNANKMGTSMEMIQNAYQGFAKQNYTMLDNLKLGYGGTKEEMARLIEDAAKLSDTVDAQDMSFANIVKAINVVQTEMGITGTTAKEAASTIQGSVGMMKSSWTNLVTGIADDNADFDTLINNMVESVGTFAGNILPRVEVALTGIVGLIEGVAPQIVARLPEIAQSVLPNLVVAIQELVTSAAEALPSLVEVALGTVAPSLLSAIQTIAPVLLQSLPTIFSSLASGIENALPMLIETAISLVDEVAKVLPDLIDAIIVVLPSLFKTLADALLKEGLPQLVEIVMTLATELVKLVPDLVSALTEILPAFYEAFIPAVLESLPILLEGLIPLITELFAALPAILVSAFLLGNPLSLLFAAIYATIKTYGEDIKNFFAETIPQFIADIIAWFEELPYKIGVLIGEVILFFQGMPEKIKTWLLATIEKIKTWISDTKNIVQQKVPEIVDKIKNIFSDLPAKIKTIGKNIVSGLWNGINGSWSSLKQKFTNAVKSLVNGVKSTLGIKSPSRVFRDQIGKQMAAGLGIGWEQEFSDVKDDIEDSLNFGETDYGITTSSTSISDFANGARSYSSSSQNVNVTVGIDDSANAMGLARALLPFLKIAEKEVYA